MIVDETIKLLGQNKIRYIGKGLPNLKKIELKGKLIVLEGPDASGRSTQIKLLIEKLESDGHAVTSTGLRRSELMGEGIMEAKKHFLGKRTMGLFYAADFADQLENKILPALRAGYIVLADRYIYTLIARNSVRRINKTWSDNLFGFALKPDLVCYLKVDPHELIHRTFEKNATLDHYESGSDLCLSRDILQSFIKYQKLISKEFEFMERKYGLIPIDGNRTIPEIYYDLYDKINNCLNS